MGVTRGADLALIWAVSTSADQVHAKLSLGCLNLRTCRTEHVSVGCSHTCVYTAARSPYA